MKQVYAARDPVQAHFVRNLLDNEGIKAEVQSEHLFGVRGDLPMVYPSVCVVEDSDFERARALVAEYERRGERGQAKGELWQCGKCGTKLEPQFIQCWKCGASRPLEQKQK